MFLPSYYNTMATQPPRGSSLHSPPLSSPLRRSAKSPLSPESSSGTLLGEPRTLTGDSSSVASAQSAKRSSSSFVHYRSDRNTTNGGRFPSSCSTGGDDGVTDGTIHFLQFAPSIFRSVLSLDHYLTPNERKDALFSNSGFAGVSIRGGRAESHLAIAAADNFVSHSNNSLSARYPHREEDRSLTPSQDRKSKDSRKVTQSTSIDDYESNSVVSTLSRCSQSRSGDHSTMEGAQYISRRIEALFAGHQMDSHNCTARDDLTTSTLNTNTSGRHSSSGLSTLIQHLRALSRGRSVSRERRSQKAKTESVVPMVDVELDRRLSGPEKISRSRDKAKKTKRANSTRKGATSKVLTNHIQPDFAEGSTTSINIQGMSHDSYSTVEVKTQARMKMYAKNPSTSRQRNFHSRRDEPSLMPSRSSTSERQRQRYSSSFLRASGSPVDRSSPQSVGKAFPSERFGFNRARRQSQPPSDLPKSPTCIDSNEAIILPSRRITERFHRLSDSSRSKPPFPSERFGFRQSFPTAVPPENSRASQPSTLYYSSDTSAYEGSRSSVSENSFSIEIAESSRSSFQSQVSQISNE
jgi:hypothetical protein